MRKKRAAFILTLFIILTFSSVSLAAIPVKVAVGKGTVVTLKEPSKRVSLANPEIADLNLISPTELLINGKKIGATNLIVWDAKGKSTFFDITVYPEAVEPPQVMLEVRVAQIDKTKLTQLGIGYMIKKDKWEVTAPGLIGQPQGSVGNSVGLTTLGSAVGTQVGPGIERFSIGDIAPQIGFTHFANDIGVVLKALSEKGYVKILAEPNLVVRSGEKGNFLAGSRIPIQTITGSNPPTPSITFEQVGVRLNFAPEVLDSGVIRLKIDPAEVSAVTSYVQFSSGIAAPQIATREVRTSVDLREGEGLVLAGLLDDQTRKSLRKIPILGDIPILGLLFRSTDDEITKTELAFFITPRIVKPLAPGEKPELPGDKPLTPKEERELNWIPIPGKSGEEQK